MFGGRVTGLALALELVQMFLIAHFKGDERLYAVLRKWRHWKERRRLNRGIGFVLNLRNCLEMDPAIFHQGCAIVELTSIQVARIV